MACVEARVRAVARANPQRPLFVLAYGCDYYAEVALAMQRRLVTGFEVVSSAIHPKIPSPVHPGLGVIRGLLLGRDGLEKEFY